MTFVDKLLEADGSSRELREKIAAVLATRREVDRIMRKRADAEARWNSADAAILQELGEMQSRCAHPRALTTYYGDAAGGSSSQTVCDVCDARI